MTQGGDGFLGARIGLFVFFFIFIFIFSGPDEDEDEEKDEDSSENVSCCAAPGHRPFSPSL
jgi:hypothetical protein